MNSRLLLGLVVLGAWGWASGCSGGGPYRGSQATGTTHARSHHSAAATESAAEAYSDDAYDSSYSGGGDTAAAVSPEPAPVDRPGLGTEFGEQRHSRVVERPFERSSSQPFAQVAVHYNDSEGVQAQAAFRGAQLEPISAATPAGGITIALVDSYGATLPGFHATGRTYVVGQSGARYDIRITNHTAGRYEAVVSVDGLDVIDGGEAGYGKRGYIVPPYQTLVIDGFRTSDDTVAAFRFASVRDSYAGRTGRDRNVGVIGLAFFSERGSSWTSDELSRRESADPFPARYAQPPP